MDNIYRYQSQHQFIVLLCNQLLTFSTVSEIHSDAGLAFKVLDTLHNILDINLRSKDESLYPKLAIHSDSEIKNKSIKLQSEMIEATNLYHNYKTKYANEEHIQENPHTYIDDTQTFVDTLINLIEKEDNLLYSLT